ncbi:MAG TPA: peroxiredoxin [Acidimicrobiales bacterium]|nr:peroxiredoxin [Acidimicrobiales bacterium]
MQIGDLVADFSLSDQFGRTQSLYGYLDDGPVVLFFYPAAMTKGCTMESCHFRDLKSEFEAVGAQRIGISKDTVDKQRQFSDLHEFDYPLLSDASGSVAGKFGVSRSFSLLPVKRWTFVVGTDRRLVDVIKSEVRMDSHADRALDQLRKLSSAG